MSYKKIVAVQDLQNNPSFIQEFKRLYENNEEFLSEFKIDKADKVKKEAFFSEISKRLDDGQCAITMKSFESGESGSEDGPIPASDTAIVITGTTMQLYEVGALLQWIRGNGANPTDPCTRIEFDHYYCNGNRISISFDSKPRADSELPPGSPSVPPPRRRRYDFSIMDLSVLYQPSQIDPSRFQIDLSRFQINPSRFQINPSRFQIDLSRFQIDAFIRRLSVSELIQQHLNSQHYTFHKHDGILKFIEENTGLKFEKTGKTIEITHPDISSLRPTDSQFVVYRYQNGGQTRYSIAEVLDSAVHGQPNKAYIYTVQQVGQDGAAAPAAAS